MEDHTARGSGLAHIHYIDVLTISGERSIMFYCEMCGSGDCCERTDIHGGPILCDKCYMEAKRDQEDKDAIEEIFKDN
nr:MAG TPA: RRN7 Zinc-finger of RNA-polymerase I-specific TFIIB, Rrn7 [Caudoviricetes sp.]